jgi:AcrR family transcriptional regulator
MFLKHGFAATPTDVIQEAAGVSKSTMYAHFPSKDALFVAVIEDACAEFLGSVRQVELSDSDVTTDLRSLAHAYLHVVLATGALRLFRVVVAEGPRFPDLARRFYLAGPGAMNELVSKHLDRAAERGEIDFSAVGRDAAATLFVNLVRSEAMMQCLTHPDSIPSEAQKDQWANLAVITFLRAFGTQRNSR